MEEVMDYMYFEGKLMELSLKTASASSSSSSSSLHSILRIRIYCGSGTPQPARIVIRSPPILISNLISRFMVTRNG